MSSLSSRTRSAPAGFIEPCLPSPADKPPAGGNWIHEIKHDGYRLIARRDPVGGDRYPLVLEAAATTQDYQANVNCFVIPLI